MAAYNMDPHNTQRIVWNGTVKNEGDVQIKGIQPYTIAYRAITPGRKECTNLLVPVCLSASHIAYGSIRMEPVFMFLAQSAAMALDQQCPVQTINVEILQEKLKNDPLANGSAAEILVDDADIKTVTGYWKKETTDGYGSSFLLNNSKQPSGAHFEPEIKRKEGTRYIFIIPGSKTKLMHCILKCIMEESRHQKLFKAGI
ncbi:MAG: FAD-dependent oxidoreductase [Agriterribacter sp.]